MLCSVVAVTQTAVALKTVQLSQDEPVHCLPWHQPSRREINAVLTDSHLKSADSEENYDMTL